MAKPVVKKNPNISSHWAVPVLTKKFGAHQKINPDLLGLFYEYKRSNPRNQGSVYSSPDNLDKIIKHPSMERLSKFIMDGVFEIASHVNAPYWKETSNIHIDVTGIWFQITNDYGFHETHIHGNCSWSGVYYVQSGNASKNASELASNGMPNGITRFYGPQMEITAGGHGDNGNLYLQDHSIDSYPEDGKLVIFPSHLKHMVYPYAGEDDRVIVSFHAQVNGDTELRYGYSFS